MRIRYSSRLHSKGLGRIVSIEENPTTVFGNASVLILEDDHDTRVTLRTALELHGIEVHSAANGKSGLEILQRLDPKPRVILLDLRMPLIDGWSFLKARRKDSQLSAIPVIVMTAERLSMESLGHEISGFFRKPLDLPALMYAVAKHCPGHLVEGSSEGSGVKEGTSSHSSASLNSLPRRPPSFCIAA